MITSNKDISKTVSASLGVCEKEVAQVLDLLMRTTEKQMENLVNNEIYIYGLGSFKTKRRKIYDHIIYYENKKQNIINKGNLTPSKEASILDCDVKIEKLKLLNAQRKEKDEQRKVFKQQYNEQKPIDGSIQESEIDMECFEK